jgi:hypothetical protein
LYEADDAEDDGRDTRARRADAAAAPDAAAALEELPADFDDEEIDEDGAWTAEDRARWVDLDFAGGTGREGDDDGGTQGPAAPCQAGMTRNAVQ